MKKLLGVLTVVGLVAPAMASDLVLKLEARFDVGSIGIGNNPASVAWDGTDVYVGGINNGSTGVAIGRIANALSSPTTSTFGAATAEGSAGYEYLDVDAQGNVYASFTANTTDGAALGFVGSTGASNGWGAGNNGQAGALEGVAFDRRFGGLGVNLRRNRGFAFRERQCLHVPGELVGPDRFFGENFPAREQGVRPLCIKVEAFKQDHGDHVAFHIGIDAV